MCKKVSQTCFHYQVHVCAYMFYVSVAYVRCQLGDFAMNLVVAVGCTTCCSMLFSHCKFAFCCNTIQCFIVVIDMARFF